MRKKGLEFSFAWLFAIIVGAAIVFISIYATTNVIEISRDQTDATVAAELGILLNPIETNLEDNKYALITFPDETRVHNGCRETGNFGRQLISTSVRSGIGSEWTEPGVENSFFNKYLFSQSVEQGEELHVFVKPFYSPYKVADLVFATTGSYCFVNPPNNVEEDITSINAPHINITNDQETCPAKSITTCFGTGDSDCDITVDVISKRVIKNAQEIYYDGPLIYGAIFADSGIYECQVQRLLKRTSELAHVYSDKTTYLSGKGCPSNLEAELTSFALLTAGTNSSFEFTTTVVPAATIIDNKNENLACRLY